MKLQPLNNPAFDPSVYQNFVPQDAVQQYIGQYGSPVYSSYPQYTEALIPTFENYLIPAVAVEAKKDQSLSEGIMVGLGPVISTLIKIFTKVGGTLLSIAGVVLLGGVITSIFCTFTPFCRVSFLETPLEQMRNNTRDALDKIGTEVTTERIKRAAEFVVAAIEKFENLQKVSRMSRAYKK